MRLTVVGCTGSMSGPASPASCYLLTDTDTTGRQWQIVLDLGHGAGGALQRFTGLRNIDAVALSHLHPDHCADLWSMYVAWRYHPTGTPDRKLPVYAPTTARTDLAPLLGISNDDLNHCFDLHYWEPTTTTTIGPFSITPYIAEHPIQAYCLRLTTTGPQTPTLAFSGDTDDCPGLRAAAQDADLLLAEASFLEGRDTIRGIHLTGARAGQVATDCAVKQLVLTHIPPCNDPAVAVAEATRHYHGPTSATYSGHHIDITAAGKTPEMS